MKFLNLMHVGWLFWGGILMQCAALFALMRPHCCPLLHLAEAKTRLFLRFLLLASVILICLYAWHNADFVLCLGQILLAVVLWSALPSHASAPDHCDGTSTEEILLKK